MNDDEAPDDAGDDPAAGGRLLDEQRAGIAALRKAVLDGKVEEESFDYAAFFEPAKDRDGSTTPEEAGEG